MIALALPSDVEARAKSPLTQVERERVATLLVDASAKVRRYCDGQQFTAGTTTLRSPIVNGRVRLPQRPVTAITSVAGNGTPIGWWWDGTDSVAVGSNVIDSFAFEPWRNGIQVVDVTYTHGYTTIPDDIVGVVCNIVLRAVGQNPTEGGITSETIQGYSYTTGAIGAAGAFGMLADELATLDAYRRPVGVASTVPTWR